MRRLRGFFWAIIILIGAPFFFAGFLFWFIWDWLDELGEISEGRK